MKAHGKKVGACSSNLWIHVCVFLYTYNVCRGKQAGRERVREKERKRERESERKRGREREKERERGRERKRKRD